MKPINGFLPRAISPLDVEGPSAITCPFPLASPLTTIGSLIVAVALVASQEFGQFISLFVLVILFDSDFGRCDLSTTPFSATTHTPESTAAFTSIPVPDYRSFCSKKRYLGLTLHVGSHQRTVGIIVLQEWNQCCSYREYHLRRYVHVIKHFLSYS